MKNFKCFFGYHNFIKKHELLGFYKLTITNEDGSDDVEIYDVYFYECKRCFKRKITVVGGKSWKKHRGIQKVEYRWINFGVPYE